MKIIAGSLDKILASAEHLKQVNRSDLRQGDRLLLFTRNSCYSLLVLEDNGFLVSGGWFDRKRMSPVKTTVTGCSWGGSVIKVDIVAACGLSMEFGNRLVTSAIQKIVLFRHDSLN